MAADRVAVGLRRAGVVRGDRVVVHLENGLEAVQALIGALRAGAVIVPLNPTMKAEKLGYVFHDCSPAAVISDRRADAVVAQALEWLPSRPAVFLTGLESSRASLDSQPFESLLDSEGGLESFTRIDLDLAALVYTSGSTGQPKGVMLTHGNICAATSSINRYLQNTEADVILDVLPLSFDYGLYQLFLALQSGARLVLERSFAYPATILGLMARERITALPIVPMMAALLLRHDLRGAGLQALRYLTNTGAALPAAHITALRESLPHVRIFSMYGLTECKRVSYLDPSEIDRRPGSVGKPMDNVEAYLVDADGRRLDCGVGELVVRGANVMQGYWNAGEDTARVLKSDPVAGSTVLHTGDIFRIDDEGFLYFQHRLDDVIKSRGQKVSPREVENVLYGAPGVSEALVVGVSDDVVGEALVGYVTLRPGSTTTERDVLSHCAMHLEGFMLPREIAIVSALPHNPSGKLSRRELQESIAS
jgi:amino acid adenylation domain-containing protein